MNNINKSSCSGHHFNLVHSIACYFYMSDQLKGLSSIALLSTKFIDIFLLLVNFLYGYFLFKNLICVVNVTY